ncbi:uncharacterized protein LOC113234937 [Hyposmocoma kahamanoa]|uniref:uncharacterized protein LOC113234937 n=1 Tax=Hyposmocoma kahamanoa TaxID=1477025 RepID=UPI000E6D91AD|nr:uncharacterized protein LOC113234937 [Hyposmocoma kahamanoa]
MLFSKIQFQSACEGKIIGVFTVEENMCNNMDALHGGYICSIMDAVTTYAQMSNKNGRLSWTTDVQAKFLKSARLGDRIVVETTPLTNGSHSVMEATLRNEATGSLIAKGTVTLVAGAEKFQHKAKDVIKFDVYEED